MKTLKEILCFPFYIIAMMGLSLIFIGWIFIELIAGKEVQVKLSGRETK